MSMHIEITLQSHNACHVDVVSIISSMVFFNLPTKTDTFTPNSHSLLYIHHSTLSIHYVHMGHIWRQYDRSDMTDC